MSNVYFIQCSATKAIKIGFSEHVENRIAALRTSGSAPLDLLLVVPGTRETEADLHRRFRRTRLNGEWFKPDEVGPFVEKLSKMDEKSMELMLADRWNRGLHCDDPVPVEILHDACVAVLRERGVTRCAREITAVVGGKRGVTVSYLQAVLEGCRPLHEGLISYFARHSPLVEDAIEQLVDWQNRDRDDDTGKLARLRIATRRALGPEWLAFNAKFKASIAAEEQRRATFCECGRRRDRSDEDAFKAVHVEEDHW